MGYYLTARICENGHTITDDISNSASIDPFCSKCGAKTITQCPSCGNPIRGSYDDENMILIIEYTPPAYCSNCGKALPWIQARLDAAKEFISDLDELDQEDREKFSSSLPDIVVETPRTALAANRVRKYLNKITPTAKEGLKQIFFDITIEAAKKMIWP